MARCSICSGKYHQIPSDGPRDARIVVYAERPGQWEESNARKGYSGYGDLRCLVGPTGREWNELYLPLAGLDRDDIHVGNTVQCGADSNRKPTAKEVQICGANHIPQELEECNPEIVILMGATACSLIPEIDLEVQHGIPFWGRLYDWSGWIVPMYHPALGLHEGSKMGLLLDDWTNLGPWLRGEGGSWPTDELVRDYGVCRKPRDIEDYFLECPTTAPRLVGIDTESHGGIPFSIQLSIKVGTGRLILLNDKRTVIELVAVMNEVVMCGGELVFHNHPADIDLVMSLGIEGFLWRDTMMEAYHLGLPQGLKALSYRLLGRKRKSWEETVTPASKVRLYEWLTQAIKITETWRDSIERVGKRGQLLKPKLVKSKFEGTLTSILNHMLTGEDYDVWAKLKERASGMEMECIEDELGPPPVKGVAHLSLDELVEYGCSDADDSLAVALELERLRGEFGERVRVREEDRDYVACQACV